MLRVSRQPDGRPEIFASVQGEGASIGRPGVFLRLASCNLSCIWCDTKYTWDWKHYNPKEQILDMSEEDVEKAITGHNCKRVIVTGGEPLLQQRPLAHLLRGLRNQGATIEIETNGTVVPTAEMAALVQQWNVSPKLETSGNTRQKREIPEAYRFFSGLSNAYFKYVVQDDGDFSEVQGLVQRYSLDTERVILMPQAQDISTLQERGRWLAGLCTREGYRFSTRLQVILWGNTRGR